MSNRTVNGSIVTEQVNDFKPECRALISRLQAADFVILGGHNGEDRCKWDSKPDTFEAFLDELLACDECNLYVQRSAKKYTLFLVLGNSPGELVCDYTAGSQALDDLTMAHFDEWTAYQQPKALQHFDRATSKITYEPLIHTWPKSLQLKPAQVTGNLHETL